MGHFYSKTGEPVYTVPRATGKGERDTHIGDARKLGLVPSVTSILGILDKPALGRWLQNEVLDAVLKNPPGNLLNLDIDKWKKDVLHISQKKSRDAADRGVEIHDALEQYYLGNKIPNHLLEYCTPVIELLLKEFGNVQWVPEASFAHPSGFGGKCDLHLLPCYEYPNGVVLDFKTKSADDFTKVKPYFEQCMQVQAYAQGFRIPNAVCYDLFISTKQPGQMLLHTWDDIESLRAWECFQNLVCAWQLINNFVLTP